MKVFVNGQESRSRCLLYEFNSGEILEFRNDNALLITKSGNRIVESPEIVEIEEKGKTVSIKIGNKDKTKEYKDVRKFDFN